MKTVIYLLLPLLGYYFFGCNTKKNADPVTAENLRQNFANPGGTARPKTYWWWLNGFTDKGRIQEELQAIKDAGLGGVDIFEIGFRPDGVVPAGPAFMSDSSLDHIAFAIKEATRHGLEVGLNLSSSWNAGGAWVEPQHAAKTLYLSTTSVKGGAKQTITIPFPAIDSIDPRGRKRLLRFKENGRPEYSKEVATLAVPVAAGKSLLDTAQIIDLSSRLDTETDRLTWDAPEGDWEIHRYVCANTGENLLLPSPNSHGPILDHFDSTATEAHFLFFINKLQEKLGDLSATTFKNLYLASYEARTTVWTSSLEDEFRRINGYEIHKLLPAVFDENLFTPAISQAFKADLNLTVSELMIRNHYRKGSEIANRYGLKLISESGGPGPPLHNVPVEAIKALGALDVPRGEFWINHARYDDSADSIDLLMLVKEVAAASNIYKRKITELEAFTSFQNWQEGPGDMKPIGDRAFCEGMSRPVIHGFTHNPPGMGSPGIVYYAGTHFNDKVTWWPKVKPFNDYLARVSYILQETHFTADVLYYYGDRTPNFATPKNTTFAAGSGFDYEIINTDILLNDLRYENGMLHLSNGAEFKVLALDSISGRNPAVTKKIEALRSQGATITDRRLANVSSALAQHNLLPDFDYPDKGSDRLDYMKASQPVLDYIHHKLGDHDFYFIRNTRNETVSRNCLFRQTGKSPEIWDPINGEISVIHDFQQIGKQAEVPITLPPFGSTFVVFSRPEKSGEVKTEVQSIAASDYLPKEQIITGTWYITFDEKWGAPRNVAFTDLMSWTESAVPGVKYYSGSAIYSRDFDNSITAGESEKIYLDLGKVARVADVWLNGQHLGITWTPPYRYDVTDLLKPGSNSLKVEVINTWSNRIIGDLTSEKKYTNTNVKERGSRELTWAETPLLESGLIGPVKVYTGLKKE